MCTDSTRSGVARFVFCAGDTTHSYRCAHVFEPRGSGGAAFGELESLGLADETVVAFHAE